MSRVKCHAERSRSICYRTPSASPSKNSLSLVIKFHSSPQPWLFTCIFFKSFSLYFFEKSTKNMGSCVRHSVLPLFKSRFATSFSRRTPRRSLLVAMLGVARTRCAQTSCHLFPSIARLLTVPPNAALPPPAGNYLLCGIFELPPQLRCSPLFVERGAVLFIFARKNIVPLREEGRAKRRAFENAVQKVIPRQRREGSVGRHSEQPSNAWKQVA